MARKTINIAEDALSRISDLVDLKIYLKETDAVNDVIRRGLLLIEKENGITRRNCIKE